MFEFFLRKLIVFVVSFLALSTWGGRTIAQSFVPGCPDPSFPTPLNAGLGIDDACAVGGSGGAEAEQNKSKNNFCAGDTPKPITIDDMVSLQSQVQKNKSINFGNPRNHPLSTKAGPTKNRGPLRDLGEGGLRTLEGFVMIAREEGKESVNCGTSVPNQALFHDIHISIVQTEEDTHGDECNGVVAEMSPHHRARFLDTKKCSKGCCGTRESSIDWAAFL